MKTKKIILMRESDYNKVIYKPKRPNRWWKPQYTWDEITFVPLTADWIQKQYNWYVLKGDKKNAHIFKHWAYPDEFIARANFRKHDSRYRDWLINYNENGEMTIRASINLPKSRLGFAILTTVEPEVEPDDNTTTQEQVQAQDHV